MQQNKIRYTQQLYYKYVYALILNFLSSQGLYNNLTVFLKKF